METDFDIKAIRETLKLTQTALAEKIGVNQGDVSNWERGRNGISRAARKAIERLLEEHQARAA